MEKSVKAPMKEDDKEEQFPLATTALDEKDDQRLVVNLKKGRVFEWSAHSSSGVKESNNGKRTLYLALECEDDEKLPLSKASWDIKEEMSFLCHQVWEQHNVTFRNLLRIPKDATVIVNPTGTYNPLYGSLSLFPNVKYCKFYVGDTEPPKLMKNIRGFITQDDEEDGPSFDICVAGVLKTIHFSVAQTGEEYHVLAKPFFNAKTIVLLKSLELQNDGRLKQNQRQVESLVADLKAKRGTKRKDNDSASSSHVTVIKKQK